MSERYTGSKGRKALTETQKADKAGKKEGDALSVPTFLPGPGEGLPEEAREEWLRVGEYLRLTDRVAKLDHQSLTHYAVSYSLFCDAMRPLLIGRQPLWGVVRGKSRPATQVDIATKHGQSVLRLARKFGMTARTRHLDHRLSGRPATPDQMRRLKSGLARRKRPLPIEEQEWSAESVACPGWMPPAAVDEWQRLVDQLSAIDLWTPLDVAPIAICAAAFALAKLCIVEMESQPLVLPIQDSEATAEHPLAVIYDRQFTLCEAVWQDYGMTPFDRQQFHHVEGEKQGQPKLEIFPEGAA